MDESEVFVVLVNLCIAFIAWAFWYWKLNSPSDIIVSPRVKGWLMAVPVICTVLMWVLLGQYAASDVRDSGGYMFFYVLLGVTWLTIGLMVFPYFGLNLTDDIINRRNAGAAFALAGAMIGLTFCYIGGNIGEGPGWWVVVFSAGLSTAAYFGLWFVLDYVTDIMATITIERDRAASLRLAGYLIAAGIILGRSVAGDWVSMEATTQEFFVLAVPALILLVIAVIIEIAARPTVERPVPPPLLYGWLPSAAYVIVAAVLIFPQLSGLVAR
ncbi:MAG: hypothetical protein KF716_34050 [Anaerolineae bacterium]|nr:hypothetical protein [Anaerolineae bacterium]